MINLGRMTLLAASILPPLHPSPHLDFEINFPPGASGTISTLKMSQMVE